MTAATSPLEALRILFGHDVAPGDTIILDGPMEPSGRLGFTLHGPAALAIAGALWSASRFKLGPTKRSGVTPAVLQIASDAEEDCRHPASTMVVDRAGVICGVCDAVFVPAEAPARAQARTPGALAGRFHGGVEAPRAPLVLLEDRLIAAFLKDAYVEDYDHDKIAAAMRAVLAEGESGS